MSKSRAALTVSVGEVARAFFGLGNRGLRAVVDAVGFGTGVIFVLFLVGHAEDGGGVADAARVERDDIVGLNDGFAEALGRVVGQR